MLLLRAIILWSILSVHVVGGAVMFRRLFPRESVWFGFVVPPLVLISILNFVERMVAMPSLLWLLPFTTLGCLWALFRWSGHWGQLRLPVAIFLAAFAFNLTLRALRPDIMSKNDGVLDLSLMTSFCMGQKVSPPLILYPPVLLSHYYAFGHYGLSVLTRLFGLDTGTGFNLGTALLGAWDCVLVAGVAWRVSGRKFWVTILAPILLVCAGTGASAYLALTTYHLNPNDAGDILSAMDDSMDHNPLWKWVHPAFWYDRPDLVAPGAWTWIGSYHSTTGGQFLIFLMGLSLVELLRRKRSNWPWICMGAIPFFSIVTSTWALVVECPILLVTLFWIWRERFSPRNRMFVALSLGGLIVLLLPAVLEFLTTTAYPGGKWSQPEERTQFVEFALLWWPVCLPWIALLCIWNRLLPAVKTLIVVLPIALLAIEFYQVGGRPDWTSKLWGYVYAMGWVVFVPSVCARDAPTFRVLTLLLIYSGAVSLASWTGHAIRRINWSTGEILQLQGTSQITLDPLRGPLLTILSQIRGQTIISGRSAWLAAKSPALADFTGNYDYVSWSFFDDIVAGGNTYQDATFREKEVNDLYDGKNENPLLFLRTNNIAALVIYSEDNIQASVVERLKTELAPLYEYNDFSDGKTAAGIFVYRPQMSDFNQ